MRAPKLLRPRPDSEIFIRHSEQASDHSRSINQDIKLPARDVVVTLREVMLAVQRRIEPLVTFEIYQNNFRYYITLRWQSSKGQVQLEGDADQLGLSFKLTSAFGPAYATKDGYRLASWNCRVSTWSERGKLNVYRLNGTVRGSTYLSTALPVFMAVERRKHHDYPSRQCGPVRSDLIDDIVTITQGYVRTL